MSFYNPFTTSWPPPSPVRPPLSGSVLHFSFHRNLLSSRIFPPPTSHHILLIKLPEYPSTIPSSPMLLPKLLGRHPYAIRSAHYSKGPLVGLQGCSSHQVWPLVNTMAISALPSGKSPAELPPTLVPVSPAGCPHQWHNYFNRVLQPSLTG